MKVEVDVLGSPNLSVLMVSVDVKQHQKYLLSLFNKKKNIYKINYPTRGSFAVVMAGSYNNDYIK